MAHERTQEPWNQQSPVPAEFSWPTLITKDGDALEIHYRHTLEALGKHPGMLGVIFRAEEIAEDLRAALEQFSSLGEDLRDRE
jgi:hypothetical protein